PHNPDPRRALRPLRHRRKKPRQPPQSRQPRQRDLGDGPRDDRSQGQEPFQEEGGEAREEGVGQPAIATQKVGQASLPALRYRAPSTRNSLLRALCELRVETVIWDSNPSRANRVGMVGRVRIKYLDCFALL